MPPGTRGNEITTVLRGELDQDKLFYGDLERLKANLAAKGGGGGGKFKASRGSSNSGGGGFVGPLSSR